jgi:hypothetical protein
MPIFISGVSDTRTFLAWLQASCPNGLKAQIKGEKLMVIPSTANGFRAAVSSLRELPHLHAPGGSLCAAAGKETG